MPRSTCRSSRTCRSPTARTCAPRAVSPIIRRSVGSRPGTSAATGLRSRTSASARPTRRRSALRTSANCSPVRRRPSRPASSIRARHHALASTGHLRRRSAWPIRAFVRTSRQNGGTFTLNPSGQAGHQRLQHRQPEPRSGDVEELHRRRGDQSAEHSRAAQLGAVGRLLAHQDRRRDTLPRPPTRSSSSATRAIMRLCAFITRYPAQIGGVEPGLRSSSSTLSGINTATLRRGYRAVLQYRDGHGTAMHGLTTNARIAYTHFLKGYTIPIPGTDRIRSLARSKPPRTRSTARSRSTPASAVCRSPEPTSASRTRITSSSEAFGLGNKMTLRSGRCSTSTRRPASPDQELRVLLRRRQPAQQAGSEHPVGYRRSTLRARIPTRASTTSSVAASMRVPACGSNRGRHEQEIGGGEAIPRRFSFLIG